MLATTEVKTVITDVAEEKIKVGDLDAATALINVIMTLSIQFEQ